MASNWVATVTGVTQPGFQIVYAVTFTNATLGLTFNETIPGDLTTTLTRLSQIIKDKIAQLDARDATYAAAAATIVGAGGLPFTVVLPKDYGVP